MERKILSHDCLYKIVVKDNKTVVIGNYTLVNVYHLSRIIWTDRRYYNAIDRKAEKAHAAGLLYRLPPVCCDIFVEVADLRTQLEAWCHRDAAAKEALDHFDFVMLKRSIIGAQCRRLQQQADQHEALAADHTAKRRKLLDELEKIE